MEAQEIQQKVLHTMRGELALLVAVLINSFGVVLMLHSGAGISAISSVPFAFSEVFTRISLGTWTYLFQGVLVLSLMILRKRFVRSICSALWWDLCSENFWMCMRRGSIFCRLRFRTVFSILQSAIC